MSKQSSITPFNLEQFAWLKSVVLDHLETVVAIHSCSDESSTSIPSSQGQVELTHLLRRRFIELNAQVEVDDFANIIARYPGRGRGVNQAPIALMIHLDTAHGTIAIPQLNQSQSWEGDALHFERNPSLKVNIENYPSLQQFVGHTIIHGFGDAPFGLDDKLGLTHLLTLATLISKPTESLDLLNDLDLPPIWLIGRPDEEIGRDEALIGLAEKLHDAGVTRGYTIDGIEPFEVNIANFFAGKALFKMPQNERVSLPNGVPLKVTLGGVNTHGATAHAEGHRGAIRWLTELWRTSKEHGLRLCNYEASTERECDGIIYFWAPHLEAGMYLRQALTQYVEPHISRGASLSMEEWQVEEEPSADSSLEYLVDCLNTILFESNFSYPLLAEDSSGWQGYSHPAQLSVNDESWTLSWRLRDFELEQLINRATDLEQSFNLDEVTNGSFEWSRQYDNMAHRLESAPELITWATQGAENLGLEAKVMPIRGGTGVDPFLDRGIMVANLGTGYFSPESEKELTSLEFMIQHALWLISLLKESTAS